MEQDRAFSLAYSGSDSIRTMHLLVVVLSAMIYSEPALAVPSFARKYEMSCTVCHTVFPKLTVQGEAFRLNGYQFPQNDELFVKSEPLSMGSEAWKDMWPNSIWPSSIPAMPPLFFRVVQQMSFHTDPPVDGKKWDMDFPHEIVIGAADTIRKDITYLVEMEWEPKDGKGGVDRAFIQFSNLLAWSEKEDNDGMRMGHQWLTLPPRALNLKIGKFETGVIMPVLSQQRRVGIQQAVPIRQRVFANQFRFEPVQSAAVELNGILRQYTSYAVGIANGGIVSGGQLDDNTNKDVYFRVGHKWFGYPLDGRIGSSEPVQGGQTSPKPPADEFAPPMLDFWRECGFETGVFGWWGKAEIPAETHQRVTSLDPFAVETVIDFPGRSSNFSRIGVDSRFQWFDLDVYGMAYWGHDSFAGRAGSVDLGPEDHLSWFVQADYMFKPWILAFLRYDQTIFDELARADSEETKVTPGAVIVLGPNLVVRSEWVLDIRGNDVGGGASTNRMAFQLDYAF